MLVARMIAVAIFVVMFVMIIMEKVEKQYITLTAGLDTPDSKLHRKGVASVRSRVTNLKDLMQFDSLDSLQAALQEQFSASDPEIVLTPGQLAEIEAIRKNKYSNPDWIEGKWTEND